MAEIVKQDIVILKTDLEFIELFRFLKKFKNISYIV